MSKVESPNGFPVRGEGPGGQVWLRVACCFYQTALGLGRRDTAGHTGCGAVPRGQGAFTWPLLGCPAADAEAVAALPCFFSP